MHCVNVVSIHEFTQHMSPAFNGSSALQRFERGNAIKICNGTMFDFYLGLPHMTYLQCPIAGEETENKRTGGEGGEALRVTVVQLTHRWMSFPGLLNTFTPYSTTQVDRRRKERGREGGREGGREEGREKRGSNHLTQLINCGQ